MATRRLVSRRAVPSAKPFRAEQYIDFDVSPDELFPYLVKLAILHYRNEPRFWVPKPQPEPVRSHIRRPSSANLIHSTAALSELSKSKASLPRGFCDLLDARLRQIALNKHEYESNELARRIFLAFYAAFSDNTKREISKSKRVEPILMKFISTSEKEISKTLDTGYRSSSTDHYTSLFCQLLLDILKTNGYSSSHNNLIVQLEKYKVSLSQSATLRPNVATTGSTANGSSAAPEHPVYPTPSFRLNDIAYASLLATLFNKSETDIQNAIYEYKEEATLEIAMGEIMSMTQELQNNRSLNYQRIDFDSESAYAEWKAAELKNLDSLLNKFTSKQTPLSSVSPIPPTVFDNKACYGLTPPDPRSYFHLLIDLSIKRDARLSDSNGEESFVLSKESQDFLNKVARFWQISLATRTRIMLHVSCGLYESGLFSLEKLANEVFPLSERMETEKDGSLDEWTKYDKGLSYVTMERLYSNIVDKIVDKMSQIYATQRPIINPLMEFIVNFILPNVEFDEFPTLEPSKEQLARARELITTAAYAAYTKEAQKLLRDDSFSDLHIAQISDAVISYAQLLQKRFKRPLFQKINVPNLATEVMLTDFAGDAESMVTHYIEVQKAKDNTIGFEEAVAIYKKLASIRDLYTQLKTDPFPFDIETKFEPFINEHLQSLSDTLVTWVESSFLKDNFLPSEKDGTKLTSPSVDDLFASLNSSLNIVNKITWENDVQCAKFYTILMRGVSSSIVKYCELMYLSFEKDLAVEEESARPTQYKNRGEMWMDKALKAVNGPVEVKPYHFQKETCIKLNDIERSLVELDRIEAQVDSERQAALLARVVQKEPQSKNFFFTFKICEATGLQACDMNGLSDPYVTLIMDEKQIARTQTVYEDLNPVWNESFELTISSGRSLILNVWDENAALNHSLCGRTLINVDPHGFRDFEPQDFWLELKPQGHLRLNITMESERDDIRFYFGKSYRKLMRTESDMIREIVGKFQAFIKYTISLSRLKSLVNPKFNMDTVTNLFKGKATKPKALGRNEIALVLDPLFDFLNANFATLFNNLSESLKTKIMTKTWEVVLDTLELLLIPPLSDKRTSQVPLTTMEKDALMIWADTLWEFFHHGGKGIPTAVLNSRKRQEFVLAATNFYDWPTADLKKTCERSAVDTMHAARSRTKLHGAMRRSNTVMAHRNRRALREQQDSITEAERQSTGQEVVILRILRLRGEYAFVAKRLRQLASMSEMMATEMYNGSRGR